VYSFMSDLVCACSSAVRAHIPKSQTHIQTHTSDPDSDGDNIPDRIECECKSRCASNRNLRELRAPCRTENRFEPDDRDGDGVPNYLDLGADFMFWVLRVEVHAMENQGQNQEFSTVCVHAFGFN
jgi:hypothetical protein